MKITSLMVGPIMTNCYIVCDEAAGVCAVVDPGDEAGRIDQAIAATGCTLQAIWLTHGHFDHCNGVAGLLAVKVSSPRSAAKAPAPSAAWKSAPVLPEYILM